ncbi:hypothetical protein ACJJIK_12295 [Microbulbifer sp. ZKSA006]|uniref:hypothetical protein n=1 Tax=Microbulbifer sp. ZKSA006 TaxID=3243390 RepID=UPI00403907B5
MLYPEEQDAKNFFENLGMTVSPIQTGDKKTPDFYIDAKKSKYIVEVKSRKDSEDWNKTLNSGKFAEQERRLNSDRWATDVAKKAITQMTKHDPKKEKLWVLWLSIDCEASREAMRIQTLNTLFGVRDVIDAENFSGGQATSCLYASPSTFERYKDICAVIVTCDDSINFCINEDSPKHGEFLDSDLYKEFENCGIPTSYSTMIENGCFTLKGFERKNKSDEQILDYLAKKYDLGKALFLDMKSCSVTARSK